MAGRQRGRLLPRGTELHAANDFPVVVVREADEQATLGGPHGGAELGGQGAAADRPRGGGMRAPLFDRLREGGQRFQDPGLVAAGLDREAALLPPRNDVVPVGVEPLIAHVRVGFEVVARRERRRRVAPLVPSVDHVVAHGVGARRRHVRVAEEIECRVEVGRYVIRDPRRRFGAVDRIIRSGWRRGSHAGRATFLPSVPDVMGKGVDAGMTDILVGRKVGGRGEPWSRVRTLLPAGREVVPERIVATAARIRALLKIESQIELPAEIGVLPCLRDEGLPGPCGGAREPPCRLLRFQSSGPPSSLLAAASPRIPTGPCPAIHADAARR